MSETITAAEWRARKKKKRSKYGNVKTTIGAEKFDSKREGLRYLALKQMERDGKISLLHCQRSFDLIVNGQKICRYVGDFAYVEKYKAVVEDSKGVKTRDFVIKWKLCQALYPQIVWRLS